MKIVTAVEDDSITAEETVSACLENIEKLRSHNA